MTGRRATAFLRRERCLTTHSGHSRFPIPAVQRRGNGVAATGAANRSAAPAGDSPLTGGLWGATEAAPPRIRRTDFFFAFLDPCPHPHAKVPPSQRFAG